MKGLSAHTFVDVETGQERVLVSGFIFAVYYKHNFLPARRVEEMGTTTTNNSRNGQDLDRHHVTEAPSQPS